MAQLRKINIEKGKLTSYKIDYRFMVREEDLTAIEVPPNVLKVIKKIRIRSKYHTFLNNLAQAINLRRFLDINNKVEEWDKNVYMYSPCTINYVFDEFVSTIGEPIIDDFITLWEINLLIEFFCQCPHGYNVPSLFKPHSKQYLVIT